MPSLSEIHDRLATAEAELLFAPVSRVSSALRDDQVAELLGHLEEKLSCASFGELLSNRETERFLEDELSQNDYKRVLDQLDRLSRDPALLRRFYPARESDVAARPPTTYGPLSSWARVNGIEAHLRAPARRVAAFLPTPGLAQILRDACSLHPSLKVSHLLERKLPRSARPITSDLHEAAINYMWHRANVGAQGERRQRQWEKRPEHATLRVLSARLQSALRQQLIRDGAQRPVGLEAVYLTVKLDPPSVDFVSGDKTANRSVTQVLLSGFEDGPVRLQRDTGDEADSATARALLELAIDIVHSDKHPLHAALTAAVTEPTWSRLIQAATLDLRADDKKKDRRLAWRVSWPLTVVPVLQKKGKNGRFTVGQKQNVDNIDPRAVDERDAHVIDALRAVERGAERDVERAIRALVDHPRVCHSDRPKERIRVRRARLTAAAVPADGGVRLELRVGDRAMGTEGVEFIGQTVIVRSVEEWLVVPMSTRLTRFVHTIHRYPTVLPEESWDGLLRVLPQLQPELQLMLPEDLRGAEQAPDERVVVRLEPLDPGIRVQLLAQPLPGGPAWPAGDGPTHALGTNTGKRVFVPRDLEREREEAERLRKALSLGSNLEGPQTYRLDAVEGALEVVASLRDQPQGSVRVEWPKDDEWWVASAGDTGLRVSVNRAAEWFNVTGTVTLDDGREIPLAALLASIREGKRFVRIGPGQFARIEDSLREKLQDAAEAIFEHGGELGVGVAGLMAIESLLDRDSEDAAEWIQIVKRAREAENTEPDLPESLNVTLRDYQREGFAWLSRLSSWGAGGCLADEMGLGKTVQALAMLVSRAEHGPSLVVAPTSVALNWIKETARFAPSLTTHFFHGPDRASILSELGPGHLLVTSWDVMARDAELLAEHNFQVLVLDEAQAIKNVRTKRAKAARLLKAEWRVALTGTPIENHLGELWSLFHVISPGLLGPWEHFRDTYARPIERRGDRAKREALARRVRPFLLRRTKKEVAPELPARTEVVRPVDMGDRERKFYEAARREAVESIAGHKDRMKVLAQITRLRRLACNPRLLDNTSTVPSAKLDTFLELIDEILPAGHRALVFSQFTTHLALIREALDARRINTLYLDGSTRPKDRASLVDEWQNGDDPLFLISLKAGGTGLNLTGADYVIHLDPWWNPAAEDQASDRAHRIGQTRPVTIVRLVSQGTIEESVLKLHDKKRDLVASILTGTNAAGKMTLNDLIGLVTE